jgi:hypothetical protein
MLARLRLTIITTAAILAAVAVPAHGQIRPLPADVGPVDGGGAFVMQSCGETGSTAGWATTTNTNTSALATGFNCPPSNMAPGSTPGSPSYQQAGIWASDRLNNTGASEANAGDRAELTFMPLAGTTITRLRYWRFVEHGSDTDWHPYIAAGTTANVIDSCEWVTPSTICGVGGTWYANDTHFENDRIAYRDLALSTNELLVGVDCRDDGATHTCGNGFSINHAQSMLFSAFLTISDSVAPALGTPTGTGWTTSEWAQGTLPLSLTSSDNTGIYATRVYADGSLIATLQRSCAYDRPRPCTDEPTGAIGLPTAGLADGPHNIQLAAVDAAGNETRVTRPTALKVDNAAPAAPVSLSSPAATSQTNSFAASWALPADSGTPIVAARYQLCQNGTCGAVQNAPTLTGVSGLTLAGAGAATLRVWLVDALGHENAAGAATLTLTYAPPAPPIQQPPATTTPTPVPTPTPTPVPTPTPKPTVTKTSPALKINTLRRSGRKVTVAGTLSAKTSGRVTITYRVKLHGHSRTVTKRVAISRHAFRTTLTLSTTIAAAKTATVQVAYAGDADTKAQRRSATVRLKR